MPSIKRLTHRVAYRACGNLYNGDVYFKIARKNHNLDRARNQIKLAREMEGQLDNMKDLVNNIIKYN